MEEEKKGKQDKTDQDAIYKTGNNNIFSTIGVEQKMPKKRPETVLVVNPTSSSGSTGKDWKIQYVKIKEAFTEEPEVVFTEKSGDGTTLTRKLLKKGFKRIIAIGGDGTINEVANGFFFSPKQDGKLGGRKGKADTIDIHGLNSSNNDQNNVFPKPPTLKPINPDAIMGLLPSGTRNVLAKSLGFPEGIAECCHNFIKGREKKIDVISATVTRSGASLNHNSKSVTRIFLNAAELGVAAEIIDRSKKVRSKVKSRLVSTVTSLVATIPSYESNICDISLDEDRENVLTKMTMGVVANGKYLGGGFKAAPKANVSDGLLDIVILKDSGSLKMLDEFVNIKDGDYSNEHDILYRQAKKVSIKSKEREVTVAIDGEPIGILPATFQIVQNALTVKM